MSCTRQDKTMIRGVTKTFRIVVSDEAGDAVDLTGATVYFWVKENVSDTTPVITKNSDNAGEAEILTQAGDTLGKADIFLNPNDTQSLDPGTYYYDVLVQLSTGDRYVVVNPAKLFIEQGVVDLSGAPPPTPGLPAPQNEDEKSFQFTVPSDGDSWTISIPSSMYDGSYCVMAQIVSVPTGGDAAILIPLDSSKTANSFTLTATGVLLQDTLIDIILRDR